MTQIRREPEADRSVRQSRRRAIFLALAVVLVASMSAVFAVNTFSRGLLHRLADVKVAEEQVGLIYLTMEGAESGVRGYIITGTDDFLTPFSSAHSEIEVELRDLDRLVPSTHLDPALVSRVRDLTATRFKILDEKIAIRREKGFDAARAYLSSGQGVRVMTELHELILELRRQVAASSAQIQQEIDRLADLRLFIWVSAICVNLAFLAWSYRRLGREMQERDSALVAESAQRRLLSVTLASIGDAVIVTDETGKVTFMNSQAELLTGWDNDVAVGLPFERVFVAIFDKDRRQVPNPVDVALNLGGASGSNEHIILVSKKGSETAISESGAPVLMNGKVHGVVVVFRDMSIRHQIEQNLALAREKAERANEAKGNFLANVSHELRTPLTAIMGFAELLLDRTLSEDDRHLYTSTIERNGRLLTQLINDILDFSKIEAKRLVTESIPCSFPGLIAEVTSMLGVQAREKGLFLRVNSEGSVPEKIVTDPLRLKQVLINLISNAIKFTHAGGVEVLLKAPEKVDDLTKLRVLVTDTGVGIQFDRRGELFDPFVQADASTTRRYGGTGLGLVLSRRLAEALGGTVELVASSPGKGSTFQASFTTPMAVGEYCFGQTALLLALEEPAATPSPVEQTLAGVNVLVVEDSPDNQLLLQKVLRSRGATVDLAKDGRVGVEKSLKGKYDVVLMDLLMPDQDGYEATRELRRKGFRQPILALSAATMQRDRARALEAGCNECLLKPIDIGALSAAVERYAHQGGNGMKDLH